MLHPVGSQRPATYWRRRLILLGGILVLVALSLYVLRPDGSSKSAAGPTHSPTPSVSPKPTPSTSSPRASSSPARSSTATSAQAAPCAAAALSVAALTTAKTFKVGSTPTLYLQVTNTGKAACVQNLADSQVELRVYNGESRVWGSHDCQVQPGTTLRTLAVNAPVRIGVQWSGLSSQPNCTGTRQRVGAGAYTLYALLGGVQGKVAPFSLS